MSMSDQEREIRIKGRIDTDQMIEDLRTIDPELAALDRKIQTLWNKSDVVGRGANQFNPAATPQQAYSDAKTFFTTTPGAASAPGFSDLMAAFTQAIKREDTIAQRARAGYTTVPTTPQQIKANLAQTQTQINAALNPPPTYTQKINDAAAKIIERKQDKAAVDAIVNPPVPREQRIAHAAVAQVTNEQDRAAIKDAAEQLKDANGLSGRLARAQGVMGPQKVSLDGDDSFFSRLAAALGSARPDVGAMAGARGDGGMLASGGMNMARMLMSAAPEVALPLLALTAGGALATELNSNEAHFNSQAALLSSSVNGGPVLNNRVLQGLDVMTQGQDWNYDNGTSQKTALQLASAGVNTRQLVPNLGNTFMLSRAAGMDPKDIAGLTASLSTNAGMSHQQINRTYQDMQHASDQSGVSLALLVESMKDLSAGASQSARDVTGLAAIQKALGPSSGIVAGQLMGGVLSSQGSQAMQQAALLGMSYPQFLAAQSSKGGSATIYDHISGLAKQLDKGPNGIAITEQVLQQNGLLDLSKIDPTRAGHLITQMATSSPDQAQKAAAAIFASSQQRDTSEQQALKETAKNTQDQTSWLQKIFITLQNSLTRSANPPPSGPGAANPATTGTTNTLGGQTQNAGADPRYAIAGFGAVRAGAVNNGAILGMSLPKGAHISGQLFRQDAQAARLSGLPLSILLAQQEQENTVNGQIDASARSADGGVGLGQWTPGTHNENMPTILKYLNMAEKKLGGQAVTSKNWQDAALNPQVAALAEAYYTKAAIGGAGGNVAVGLAQYNAGVNGWDVTGKPGQGRDYGKGVTNEALKIQHEIGVTVTVDAQDGSGKKLPSQVKNQKTTTKARGAKPRTYQTHH